MLRNVFFLCLISVLKCQVLLLRFHPDFDRCSSHNVYVDRGFAVLVCFLLSCEHIQRVLCLQGSSLLAVTRQTVSRTDCVIHIFIYLTKASVKLHILDSSPSYQVDFLWGFFCLFFGFFLRNRKDSVKVLWWEKVNLPPPWIIYHVVLSCCLSRRKKKNSIFLVIALVLWIQFFNLLL